MNIIVIIKFMRCSFVVSSVAATKLPESCLVDARLKGLYTPSNFVGCNSCNKVVSAL